MELALLDMGCISFAFFTDLYTLHHNVHGLDFNDTHELFGEYADKAKEDFDYFTEHAILTEEISTAPNMAAIFMNPNELAIKEWKSIEGNTPYTVNQTYEHFISNGEDYLDALDLCREHCDKEGYNDIVSDIDEIRSYWANEINYKGKHSLEK
jgi:DNA-binding ferritin-like protein